MSRPASSTARHQQLRLHASCRRAHPRLLPRASSGVSANCCVNFVGMCRYQLVRGHEKSACCK